MLTRNNNITCDYCGRFVKMDDLADGKAYHFLCTPDSDLTKETYESQCRKCKDAEHGK